MMGWGGRGAGNTKKAPLRLLVLLGLAAEGARLGPGKKEGDEERGRGRTSKAKMARYARARRWRGGLGET